jgi:TatD DNase family protein
VSERKLGTGTVFPARAVVGAGGENGACPQFPLQFCDTHAHLNDDAYDSDREEVIRRAFEAGVRAIINVGYDLATTRLAIQLAETHGGLFATAGLHPHDAKSGNAALISELKALAAHPKVVAVGETGLDFFRDLSPRDEQIDAFRRIIALAHELALPLIVHDRDAHDEVLTILEEEHAAGVGGVMHCYSAGAERLPRALDLGFAIGLDGPVTYTNAEDLRRVAAAVPLDRLLLETDCPWLTPKPRGRRRNEPAFLLDVAQRIAEVRGISLADLAAATVANSRRTFPRLAM